MSLVSFNQLSGQESSDLSNRIAGTQLVTRQDSLTYALAILTYYSLVRENIYPDPLVYAKALIEGKNGISFMSEESAKGLVTAFIREKQDRQTETDKLAYKDYLEENEAFLLKNREKPGVTVTPSGLQYEVILMGTGPKPVASNTVKVHYTGKLIDGTEFDSSVKRGQPAQLPLSGVIPGWTEGLQLMPTGSKFIFYVPQNLGYGARGAGNTIKPYSTLIFEVELLEIVK